MDFAHRCLTNLAHSCTTIMQVQTIMNIRQNSIIVDHLEFEIGVYNKELWTSDRRRWQSPSSSDLWAPFDVAKLNEQLVEEHKTQEILCTSKLRYVATCGESNQIALEFGN